MQRSKGTMRKGKKSSRGGERLNKPTMEIGRAITIPSIRPNQRQARIIQWEPAAHTFTTSIGATTQGVFTFTVQALADTSVFSAFEAYKIQTVDIIYKPNNPIGDTTSNALGVAGWFAFDPDDNTTVSVATIAAKKHAVLQSLLEPWEITISPRPTPAVYSGGVFSGYEIGRSVWLDSDNLGVPHFGFKYAIPMTSAVLLGSLYFRYHVDVIMNE
jgi:hypothetical protein